MAIRSKVAAKEAAVTTKTKCGHCGGPRSANGCRTSTSRSGATVGEWCARGGGLFQEHPDWTVHPTPAPISKAEQKIVDLYEPQVAEAQAVVDEAEQQYASASEEHYKALFALHRAGISPPRNNYILGVDADPWLSRTADRGQLLQAEENAREALE
jgi:hypothetical protein